jgi:hypothetical protein
MPTYYLGLDVHKVRTQYCLMDPAGEILAEGSLPTEEVASVVPDDCAVVLESTAGWHHTYDALRSCAAAVKLAHPSHVKAIASARVKTDKIDARILAHLLRTDLVPEAWAPPAEVRELRDVVRLRWRFLTIGPCITLLKTHVRRLQRVATHSAIYPTDIGWLYLAGIKRQLHELHEALPVSWDGKIVSWDVVEGETRARCCSR